MRVGAEQLPHLRRVVAVGRPGVGAVAGDLEVHVQAAGVQVPGAEHQGPAAAGTVQLRDEADVRALLEAGRRRVGRDVVGEDELAVAVGVEAPLGVEDRVDVRRAGDVEPLDPVVLMSVRAGVVSGTQSICHVM